MIRGPRGEARGPEDMPSSSLPRLFLLSALALLLAPGARANAADAGAAPRPPAAAPKVAAQPAAKAQAPQKGAKKGKVPKTTTVVLFHLNRKETMTLRLRDAQGKPVKGVQKRMNRFLRCHYTNKQHAMSPRLTNLLFQTGKHWPGRRIEVVSGFRNPTVAKNPRSPHMKGLACDFRVVGVKNTELRDYLRGNMKKVGVGYYPNSSFVHLDVRKDRSAFWIDYSGPGERSVYSDNAADDLKSGRAESYHPTKIDGDFINDAPPAREDEGGGEPGAGVEANKLATPGVQGQTLAGQAGRAQQSATP
jgi:uncharacterized protein YcbK (DUF882 family)